MGEHLDPERLIEPADPLTVQVLTDEMDRWWAGLSFRQKLAISIDWNEGDTHAGPEHPAARR